MGLDIRLPIGLMFAILGALLFVFGLLTNGTEIYARSLGYNVNLWWGICLFVFGAVMFYFGRRSMTGRKPEGMQPSEFSAEGRLIEEREREEGLEEK